MGILLTGYFKPDDVRSVAAKLSISPTTPYKYRLNMEINAAEQWQRENAKISGKLIERRAKSDRIREFSLELEQEREKNKKLVARIITMEANAARLGIDPEICIANLPNQFGVRHTCAVVEKENGRGKQ